MDITASVQFISALHSVLRRDEKGAPGAPGAASSRIVARALADGWITPFEIESLLAETDPRLWQITTRELLRVFGIPVQPVFERPTRGARDAEGLDRVAVADLARLLVMLERAGLTVDPAPLCTALAPAIGAKRLLTAPELIVYWRAQRGPDEPLSFVSPKLKIGCGDRFTTEHGFTVRAFYDSEPEDDCGDDRPDVSMLVITPPAASKRRPASIKSAAGRRHLRRYLGEPRNGTSPVRPSPRPAA